MSFVPQRLPDGRLEVPARAEGPGGTIGDGVTTLAPGDPLFDEWDAWLRAEEAQRRGASSEEPEVASE